MGDSLRTKVNGLMLVRVQETSERSWPKQWVAPERGGEKGGPAEAGKEVKVKPRRAGGLPLQVGQDRQTSDRAFWVVRRSQ